MPQAFVALGAEKEVVTEVAVGIVDLYQLVVALFCVACDFSISRISRGCFALPSCSFFFLMLHGGG